MSVVDAVGWIAALSGAALAVPQGVRIAVARSVAGISVLTWQTMFVAGLAWTGHGLLTGTPQIIWTNVLFTITSAWVVRQLRRARRLPAPRTWGIPLAVAALAVGVDVWLGPVAYAAVIFVPGAIGQVAQLREILRARDAMGVSLAGLAMNLANQLLWLAYALPAGETAVVCVSIPTGMLVAANTLALHRRRARAAGNGAVANPAATPAPA